VREYSPYLDGPHIAAVSQIFGFWFLSLLYWLNVGTNKHAWTLLWVDVVGFGSLIVISTFKIIPHFLTNMVLSNMNQHVCRFVFWFDSCDLSIN